MKEVPFDILISPLNIDGISTAKGQVSFWLENNLGVEEEFQYSFNFEYVKGN